MNRRETVKLMLGVAAFLGSTGFLSRNVALAQQKTAVFTLLPLGYPYASRSSRWRRAALESWIPSSDPARSLPWPALVGLVETL